jgi:prepilin-type processing-associated H-X9-DG protein
MPANPDPTLGMFPDSQFFRPYTFAVGARDYLIGRTGPLTPAMLTSSSNYRKYDFLYCPSRPQTNQPSAWQGQNWKQYNGISGAPAIQGVYTVLGYDYYPSTYSWYYGGLYVNNGLITPSPFKEPTIPMFNRMVVARPTFSQKMGDRPQYRVMWTDRMGSSNAVFGGLGDLVSASNHLKGKEIGGGPGARIPPSATGGANVAYVDGHVEWKSASVLATTTKTFMYKEGISATQELHEFIPLD